MILLEVLSATRHFVSDISQFLCETHARPDVSKREREGTSGDMSATGYMRIPCGLKKNLSRSGGRRAMSATRAKGDTCQREGQIDTRYRAERDCPSPRLA